MKHFKLSAAILKALNVTESGIEATVAVIKDKLDNVEDVAVGASTVILDLGNGLTTAVTGLENIAAGYKIMFDAVGSIKEVIEPEEPANTVGKSAKFDRVQY